MAKIPDLPDLGDDALRLAEMVAERCLFPDPNTVKAVGGAVFPTIRTQNSRSRTKTEVAGATRVMRDDNTTPRWAFLWSHGITMTEHPKRWTFAHVWSTPMDPDAYTHLANLVMMPEYFGSLADKVGPLVDYLKFHAWRTYKWKPDNTDEPTEPTSFANIKWKYMERVPDPNLVIEERMTTLKNQRVLALRPLMKLDVSD